MNWVLSFNYSPISIFSLICHYSRNTADFDNVPIAKASSRLLIGSQDFREHTHPVEIERRRLRAVCSLYIVGLQALNIGIRKQTLYSLLVFRRIPYSEKSKLIFALVW